MIKSLSAPFSSLFQFICLVHPVPFFSSKGSFILLNINHSHVSSACTLKISGADPGFFLGGGALVSFSTSTLINHILFFCRIPVVLENRRSSWGGGAAHPLHPPPRSAPGYDCLDECIGVRSHHLQKTIRNSSKGITALCPISKRGPLQGDAYVPSLK